jgi:hypothetical protein
MQSMSTAAAPDQSAVTSARAALDAWIRVISARLCGRSLAIGTVDREFLAEIVDPHSEPTPASTAVHVQQVIVHRCGARATSVPTRFELK